MSLAHSLAQDAVPMVLDDLDRRIVVATQAGLPLVERPYHHVAEELGVSADTVMERMERMERRGIIRRIGAVPNHYQLGFYGNGMSVWDVLDERVSALGRRIGELEYVSHCYRRPRHPPLWPYNLFVMVHGVDHQEARDKVASIAQLIGADNRGHEVLFSTKVLKKTGLRLSAVG